MCVVHLISLPSISYLSNEKFGEDGDNSGLFHSGCFYGPDGRMQHRLMESPLAQGLRRPGSSCSSATKLLPLLLDI